MRSWHLFKRGIGKQGLSQAAPLRQSALQLKLSLKKMAKGTICPLQNLGKKVERKHTRRDLVQYRNLTLPKLNLATSKTERGKYILLHVLKSSF